MYFFYTYVPTTKAPLSHIFSEVKYSLVQISGNPLAFTCEIKSALTIYLCKSKIIVIFLHVSSSFSLHGYVKNYFGFLQQYHE